MKRIIEEMELYEGLDITHPINVSIDILNNWGRIHRNDSKILIKQYKDLNKISILIYNSDKEEFDNLLKMINNLGWIISLYKNIKPKEYKKYNYQEVLNIINNKQTVILTLESKFDIQIGDGKIISIERLYHVTKTVNEKKIFKIGLAPKSKEKLMVHPERIYLLFNEKDCEFLAKLSSFNKNKENMSIFLIDNKSLQQQRKMRFFEDPNFKNGIYTYENIPPQFLSLINRISYD